MEFTLKQIDSFASKTKRVYKPNGCWNWTSSKMSTHKNKYGQFYLKREKGKKVTMLAHRFAYIIAKGPIKKGLVIDHICRNGLCVNPHHLRAISNKRNILIGNGAPAVNARKKICKRGHKLNKANTFNRLNRRACKTCNKLRK